MFRTAGNSGFWACRSTSGKGVCPWPPYSKRNKGRLSGKTRIPGQPPRTTGLPDCTGSPHPCPPQGTNRGVAGALAKRPDSDGSNPLSSLLEPPQGLYKRKSLAAPPAWKWRAVHPLFASQPFGRMQKQAVQPQGPAVAVAYWPLSTGEPQDGRGWQLSRHPGRPALFSFHAQKAHASSEEAVTRVS